MRTSQNQIGLVSFVRRFATVVALAITTFLAFASSLRGDPVIAYDTLNHASGQPIYDAGAVTSPPIAIGRAEAWTETNPSPDYQWAMPFRPTGNCRLSEIRVALTHWRESEFGTNWPNAYVWVTNNVSHPQSSGPALDGPPLNLNPLGADVLFYGSLIDYPQCDPSCSPPFTNECRNCIPLEPLSPLFSLGVDTEPHSVVLQSGQKYWLVIASQGADVAGHNRSYWYRGVAQSVNDAPVYRDRHGGPDPDTGHDYVGPWIPSTTAETAAFQIIGEAMACTEPSVPIGTDCTATVIPAEESRCWWTPGTGATQMPDHGAGQYSGFPLNINLWQGFGPGDYPPKHLAPELSSVPLVSKGVAHFGGPSPYMTRPLHNDLIDIITGQPLIQAVDFELPFGGAVFRHVRTYSENISKSSLVTAMDDNGRYAGGTHWDWNGMFWMMGENPILLIDASYHDNAGYPIVYPDKKRCYFIPDAHHAIPFLHDPNVAGGAYVAPSWFDAKLQPSVELDSTTGRPKYFYCWLNRKSLKYTFEAHYEDIWVRMNGASAHERPDPNDQQPDGLGIPNYGLVKRIEDAYGNRMEYDYCNSQQSNVPNDIVSAGVGCKRCCQSCVEKGQIKRIQLISKNPETNEDTINWTLVYTHRAFPFPTYPMPNNEGILVPLALRDNYKQHHLHSINVYAGDVEVQDGCLTIPSERFCMTANSSIDDLDAIEHEWVTTHPNWVIETKYLYSECGYLTGHTDPSTYPGSSIYNVPQDLCRNANLFGDASVTYTTDYQDLDDGLPQPTRWRIGERLLKTTVTNRIGGGKSEKSYTLYRDGRTRDSSGFGINAISALKYIYEPDTVARILEARRMGLQPSSEVNPNFLFGYRTSPGVFWRSNDPVPPTHVPVWDPVGNQVITKALVDLADVVMTDYSEPDQDPCPPSLKSALVASYVGSDANRTAYNNNLRRSRLIDRRAQQKQQGEFRFHYLVQYPDSIESSEPIEKVFGWLNYRFPYRFYHPTAYASDPSPKTAPMDRPFFITVIDELNPAGGNYVPETTPPGGVIRRRVVEMNPAGFVLQDRIWSFESGEGDIISQQRFAETYKRDCMGRLIQKRSLGWGAGVAAGGDGNQEGLIEVFKYEDDQCGWVTTTDNCTCTGTTNWISTSPNQPGIFNQRPGELIAAGIQKGKEGAFTYLSKFERGHTSSGHPELITKQITFPAAVTDPDDPSGEVTTTAYDFEVDPADENLTRVIQKTVVRPPAPMTRGGALAYPVERFHYDASGNMDWHGSGLLEGASPGDAALLFTMDKTERNDLGQTTLAVIDAPASGAPAGWTRAGYPEALNLSTHFEYEVPNGLKRVQYPNLRESWIVHLPYPDGSKQIMFSDLVPDGSTYKALSPAKITTRRGQTVIEEKTARVTEFEGAPDGDGEDFETISVTTPTYDEHGRLIGMAQSNGDLSVSAEISYDGFGNIGRQEDPDGTITRNVYDERGRLARVYRGTNDNHEFWGTGRLCGPGETPAADGCFTVFPDNLVLVEKRYYGTGVNDAGELVKTRSYRDRPANQYHFVPDEGEPEPNNEDEIGSTTVYEYDWRMRPVVTRQNKVSEEDGDDGAPLSHTLTWFDNLDRPRFVAEYGGSIPSSPSPKDVVLQGTFPTAQEILSASPAPISLTETRYNARGQAEEVRRYNVSVNAGTDYTATLTFFDHKDRPIETHAPNSPIRKNEYDAKGRLIVTRSLAGDVEMTRTETTYDNDDRAIKTTTFQRVHTSTSGPLTDSNSIKTHSHSWYDITGRVIASANFGTNNTNDTYVSGDAPDYLNNPPPFTVDNFGRVTGCTYGAFGTTALPVQLTCYTYDATGRQTKVWHPDHSTTVTEYDDLGRTKATIENADAADPVDPEVEPEPDLVQRTEYIYDGSGRVTKMTAVVPGGVNQVTEFLYGAPVIDSTGGSISSNNGWIREVRFPNGATGQPSTTDILTFTYYSDGSVASRTDARGIVFRHKYDELNRRIETAIDDAAWYPPPASGTTSINPPNRVRRITYEYDNKNRLSLITTYRVVSGAEVIFCQNKYEYDAAGRLFREWQAHETTVTSTTPFVQYNWSSSSYLTDAGNANSGHNFERLASISYPPPVGQTSGRTISLGYGGSLDDIDSRLSRITHVTDSRFPATPLVDQYQYCGIAQRIRSVFGGMTQSYAGTNGYEGLDRFGRVKDLNYQKANSDPLLRYQYGYDLAGNRTFARVTQQPTISQGQTVSHDNDRSYLYAYDTLNRLTSATRGQLSATNNLITPAGSGVPTPMELTWHFDNLGNWTGDGQAAGFIQSGDFSGNGTISTLGTTHAVDHGNRITSLVEQYQNNAPYTTPTVHDIAGNLTTDGTYFYQYDAWNRLVQVNEVGTLTFASNGMHNGGTAGPVVARYAYDGLGRLIRKQSAIRKGATYIQSKDFFYDGVRRIQDVIFRPPTNSGLFEPEYPNDEGVIDPEGELNPVQIILGEDPASIGDLYGVRWTDREYIYDPAGDVDAFICQIDRQNRVMYMLQDANLNVVGLVAGPAPSTVTWQPVGTLLEQYVYEPYGKVAKSDTFHDHPVNRVGHQGLFFERYDAEYTTQNLADNANGLYYNRNRFYHPGLGRFTSRDPNETGMPILAAMATNGMSIGVVSGGFNGQAMYGDGMNLYGYLDSNPVTETDPTGLSAVINVTSFLLPGPGDFILNSLRTLVEDYSARLEFDIEWAADMEADDFWHSRWDNSWILASIGRGLYESFDIGIPGVGSVNPLDLFSSHSPAGKTFPKWVRNSLKGVRWHHIATIYGPYGLKFRKLFKQAGMAMNDPANALPMPLAMHKGGPHSEGYHAYVFRELSKAVGSKTGQAARDAIAQTIVKIGNKLDKGEINLRQ